MDLFNVLFVMNRRCLGTFVSSQRRFALCIRSTVSVPYGFCTIALREKNDRFDSACSNTQLGCSSSIRASRTRIPDTHMIVNSTASPTGTSCFHEESPSSSCSRSRPCDGAYSRDTHHRDRVRALRVTVESLFTLKLTMSTIRAAAHAMASGQT